jgi:hypothetical protein
VRLDGVIAAGDTTATTTTSADCQFVTSKDRQDGQDGKPNLNAPKAVRKSCHVLVV